MKANYQKMMNNKYLCIYFVSSLLTVAVSCHMSCGTSLLTLGVHLVTFITGTFFTIGQRRVNMMFYKHHLSQDVKKTFMYISIFKGYDNLLIHSYKWNKRPISQLVCPQNPPLAHALATWWMMEILGR